MPNNKKSSQRYAIPAIDAENPHVSRLLIRKSRFIASSCHCADDISAKSFINRIRALYPDATHNCFAYAAGPPGDTARVGSSDDGEPSGTAGRPMLSALLHGSVGEICVVVSRWFGGIKLGTGGLVRAYQDSVLENLARLPLTQAIISKQLIAKLDYQYLSKIRQMLPNMEASIMAEEYNGLVSLRLSAPDDRVADLTCAIARLTNGSGILEEV